MYPDKFITPDIVTHYIKLALETVRNQSKEEIEMDNIFKAGDKKRVRLVVVEGAPGIGKSTFALELCRQWPARESLQCFSLVVLLKLRDEEVRSAKNISDLFPWDDQSDQSRLYEEVRKMNGRGVLFVFDGFDEFPAELRKLLQSPVMKILQGKLPDATILLTTRPSAIAHLQHLMNSGPYVTTKHIEIVGFAEKEIIKYACCAFGSKPAELSRFKEYLSSDTAIMTLMNNPLNCSIITEVYQATSRAGRLIPHTQTQLYTEMALWRLSRYLSERLG